MTIELSYSVSGNQWMLMWDCVFIR